VAWAVDLGVQFTDVGTSLYIDVSNFSIRNKHIFFLSHERMFICNSKSIILFPNTLSRNR